MNVYISLNREEIMELLPYQEIAVTMSCSVWKTMKRKRLMKDHFTESEIRKTYDIYRQARKWYLTTGAPEEIVMTPKTFALWHKLAQFCAML